jgi:ketol-acid reductoisomerase
MPEIYHDEDVELTVIEDETVSIIGYGNQGRSQAQNLRDSGIDVIVGNTEDESYEQAVEDGFETVSISEATRRGDIVAFLIPDTAQPEVYEEQIAPELDEGDALLFSHGYNIYFNNIDPADYIDIIMVAPKMIGPVVRDLYERGEGVPTEVAVEQDATDRALQRTLAYAKGIGATRNGAIESSFEQETVLDLFCEQMMAGGSMATIISAFETLTDQGFDPITVVFNLYASGEAIEESRLRAQEGLIDQLSNHSQTSQYGQLTRGMELHNEETRQRYEEVLEEIRTGEFAKEWTLEQVSDFSKKERLWEEIEEHRITEVEETVHEELDLSFN